MSRRARNEQVSVTFHHISKSNGQSFTPEEFKKLRKKIKNFPVTDVTAPANVALMRGGSLVPLTDYKKIDDIRIFGAFHATYSGHSYENNEKGTIPARSINIRKFYYLLYLSKDGKIYIGAQYLGTFGGYGDILFAIKKLLPSDLSTKSTSIRSHSYMASNVTPKEIRLTVRRAAQKMGSKPSLIEKGVFSLQRTEKGSPFEQAVKNQIFPIFKLPLDRRKDALIAELSSSGIFEIDDDELSNCNIIVDVNGRQQTLYLFDDGVRATKFELSVELTSDGHPKLEQIQPLMLDILDKNIINIGKD